MKKKLLSLTLLALLSFTSVNAANAADTSVASPSNVASSSQILNAYLLPLYTVAVNSSSVPSAKIKPTGDLDTNLVAAFDIKANTPTTIVKFSAAKVLNKDVMNKVGGYVRLVLVKDGASSTAISNALLSTPASNPNVIAYNISTEPCDFTWNATDKTVTKTMSGQSMTVKFKVLPTPVAGTYTFPEDMSGNYKATIICTALDP